MLKGFKEFMARSDAIVVAVGLVIALSAFTLIQAIVLYLIAPLISVFVGDSLFEVNAFTIDGSEFRYGAVIEAAIIFIIVLAAVYVLAARPFRRHQDRDGGSAKTRSCPECTSSISAVAKRCPHCTAVVQPDPA